MPARVYTSNANRKQLINVMPFFRLIRRFASPYKWLVALNLLFNLLSTILSLFSFAAIIPVLRILFGISQVDTTYVDLSTVSGLEQWLNAAKGDLYYLLGEQIAAHGGGIMLAWLGLFLAVMTGLKCLTAWLANYYMVPLRTGVLRDLRRQLYDKVVALPLGYFTQERKGDILSRMTNDVNEVEASIMSALDVLFKDPIMITIYLLTLFVISWQLTLFVLILLPIAGLLIGRIGRNLKRASKQGQEQNADILSQMEETLSGLRVVKAFNAEDKLRERFNRLINATRQTFNRINRRYYLAHPVSEFLGTCLIAVILWFGGILILDGHSTIDAATFIYYLIIFYSIINPAKDLSRAGYSIRKGTASLERIDKVLDTRSNIIEEEDAQAITGFGDAIRYEHVSFAYDARRTVLQDINLTIRKGQIVALVGQSGSGKTTLADLLPRFYDVAEGKILIDGTDVRRLRIHDLRELMGYVNQDAILFNDTIYNNITFGVDTTQPAPDGLSWPEAVERAARIANAHEFIAALPDGYQTGIGDRGSRLSGGQRQRISIARAVLKNPPILLLDEATSALDSESEKLVQQALEQLMRDRTTLVIAHRLSTIRNADLICVLHEGRIVEQGTHDTLIKKGGYYSRLVEMQDSPKNNL
ncbi:MAG: ABC transporter ATP-binding protein [Paludibacteraceae bacterium]|nr:ABC transporter ATP-binding protein [Paludibacteraceae bacterium]MBO7456179.1 ABC transporter ATP-binding protein [Paludibacteraceae bacterium]